MPTEPPSPLPIPDAHGRAALLLAEATLHTLIARRIIDVAAAVEIVEAAVEVGEEAADEGHILGARPTDILTAIADSLKLDLPLD